MLGYPSVSEILKLNEINLRREIYCLIIILFLEITHYIINSMRSNGLSVLTFIRNNVEGLGRVFTAKKIWTRCQYRQKRGEKNRDKYKVSLILVIMCSSLSRNSLIFIFYIKGKFSITQMMTCWRIKSGYKWKSRMPQFAQCRLRFTIRQ